MLSTADVAKSEPCQINKGQEHCNVAKNSILWHI